MQRALPRAKMAMGSDFYLRYYVGHKGKFGHEFLEFEFRPDGERRRSREGGRAAQGVGLCFGDPRLPSFQFTSSVHLVLGWGLVQADLQLRILLLAPASGLLGWAGVSPRRSLSGELKGFHCSLGRARGCSRHGICL